MSHVATPADSAGGSNAATADDGHGANPIAANPVAAAALAGPGGAPAQPTPGAAPHHHAHPPPFASNPPPRARAPARRRRSGLDHADQRGVDPGRGPTPPPRHPAARAIDAKLRLHRPPMGGTSHRIDIHRRPRGAQRRRRGGVDKEDSAGDSNTAAVSEGTLGPADSTQAQHVKSGGGSPSRSVGGEEVEGGGSQYSDGGGSLRGGEAVDSHPGFWPHGRWNRGRVRGGWGPRRSVRSGAAGGAEEDSSLV